MQKTRKYKFKNKQKWANPHAGWWLNRHPSGSWDITWTHCANNCWMHFTETANASSKCNVGCLLLWWYRIVKNVSKNNSSSLEWGVGLYFRRFFLRPNFSRWKKHVSAKREHLRTVRNKDKLSQCSGLCGTHALSSFALYILTSWTFQARMGTACTLKFQQVVCGTELSSQIHLTLSTNHSLILLIIQSLAQLCIPGFQFSIFVSRSQTPAGKNKSNNTNLCSREIVNLDPLPNQSFSKRQPLSILALSILAALLQNGQSLSTIYMYMALGWTGFTCPLYTSKWRDVRFNLRYLPTFHLFHGSHPHPFSQPAWQKSRQSW